MVVMLNACCQKGVVRSARICEIGSTRCRATSAGTGKTLGIFKRHLGFGLARKDSQKTQPKKIGADEFKLRRDKVVDLAWSEPDAKFEQLLLCVPSSRTYYMARDIPYVFRQNANFRYLSGIMEPDSLLLLHSDSKEHYRSVLFLPDADQEHKKWHGPSLAQDEVEFSSGITEVHPVSYLEEFLQDLLSQSKGLQLGVFCDPSRSWLTNAYSHDSSPATFSVLEDCVMQRPKNWTTVTSLNQHIQEARVIKSQTEADVMRYASSIAAMAFKKAMTDTEAGMNERQLWAMIDYECVFNGAERLAFPPVVASGPRAATIHYIKNSEVR
ncbi:hypothetical protein RvY_09589-2 [Ramazzottius varieornatus]|uniref:Aminopeptidase P N-terminal domain-containing protein n=1 Tax=Ramazzottius varieornatus TaxID=947166 RepID=A0A1D1V9S9_RAMVA|nr:hypothetical protein RvY_09589-2 [Ramazzottius varieornatus]